jgi:hypothetical protein
LSNAHAALDILRDLKAKVHDYDQRGPVDENRFGEIEAEIGFAIDAAPRWWGPTRDVVLIAAASDLLHEAKRAVAFLEDLELSDNPVTDRDNPQCAGFYLTLSGLKTAIAKTEGIK